MLEQVRTVGPAWAKRNLQTLAVFAPLLLLTGLLGFVVPAELSLMSGAPSYNVFHLLAGAVGLAPVVRRSLPGCIAFNVVFGLIDLYQAMAGLLDWFPAALFALRPADHAVHVLIGSFLLGVGYLGRRALRAP